MHLTKKSTHKQSITIIAIYLFLSAFLFSQTWTLTKGWDLLGANSDITDFSKFPSDCVNSVFVYKNTNTANKWDIYPDNPLASVKQGKGFWINTKKDCTFLYNPLANALEINHIDVNGEERAYKTYIPENLTNDASLVFYFHGGRRLDNRGGKGETTAEKLERESRVLLFANKDHHLSKLAKDDNTIVVFPLGTLDDTEFNWRDKDKEIPYFDKLVEYFKATYPQINSKKIYTTGHSSGAIFSTVLAGKRPDVIAAAAASSGRVNLYKNDVLKYPFINDGKSIPLIALHGENDNKTNGMEETLDNWHFYENKGAKDDFTKENLDIGTYSVVKKTYKNGLSDLELYIIKGAGHAVSWQIMGQTIWDFLKSHPKK